MALKLIHMYIMVAIVTVFGQGATAQSGCSSAITSLASCLGYVQGSSSNPTSSCCTQLASVVKSQPRCLCPLLNGSGSQFGISINQTLALALPGVCNVQTPPISQCNGGNQPTAGPTASPAGSPVGSPNSSPADALTPDGSFQPTVSATNSKSVPSTNGSTSNGNTIIKMPLHLTISLLFITSILYCCNNLQDLKL